MYEEVVKVCGEEGVKNFSTIKFNLKDIRIICLLGEGSFAKVFLVRKDSCKVKNAATESIESFDEKESLSRQAKKVV